MSLVLPFDSYRVDGTPRYLSQDPINSGALSIWPFNAPYLAAGQLRDIVGGYTLSWSGQTAQFTPGRFGRAVAFDGTTTSFSAGTYSSVTAFPFSYACWFRPTVDATETIMSFGPNSSALNYGYSGLFYIAGGTIQLHFYDGTAGQGAAVAETTAKVKLGQWNHVVGVFASTTSRTVYLNGGNAVTDTTSKNFFLSSMSSAIALMGALVMFYQSASFILYYTGAIAQTRFWARELTPLDVARLYREPWAGMEVSGVSALTLAPAFFPTTATGRVQAYVMG